MHGAVMLTPAARGSTRANLVRRADRETMPRTDHAHWSRAVDPSDLQSSPKFQITKLLWTRENEPENWKRVRSVLLPKDYVRFRLTGEKATDVADASGTLLLNVARRQWSAEVLQAAEIDRSLLPALYESVEVCGKVSAKGAEATGLSVGTTVVAGAGDQAAGAIGMGIVAPGAVSATIGTSGVVFAARIVQRWMLKAGSTLSPRVNAGT